MLLWEGDPLGAVVGMCGFVPVYSTLMETLNGDAAEQSSDDGAIVFEAEDADDADGMDSSATPLQRAVAELRQEAELPGLPSPPRCSFLETPVFLGHGTRDGTLNFGTGERPLTSSSRWASTSPSRRSTDLSMNARLK